MTSDAFVRQCQLRVDAYCRAFGLDRVSVPGDEDEAIETLKAVASVCQPTPEAMTAVAEAEEQWAIDWLMDPRPEPPAGVQCDLSLGFIWRPESIARRAKHAHRPNIAGWPTSWYMESGRGPQFAECRAHECVRERADGDEFCVDCRRRVDKLVDDAQFNIPIRVVRRVADYVAKRPACMEVSSLRAHAMFDPNDRGQDEMLQNVYARLSGRWK